ncbi:MAG TPA: Y-family DNA polymerase [Chitinophagaceae bacterium]|nr:Y-family DNA polymerase [Chitinophagaceae bacterium]MCB9054687.1 Y-family DNA polymerase [Chitinophagales bacterium]HPG10522.1 Y-family DNA polymerase [Chitinophagaceae bacterium]
MKAIVDCNSFYCSCERVFRPELKDKPVVVLSNNDGCIVSRTDEAKKLGVGMAAPYYQNKDVIEKNDVTVFSSNYNLYGDLSMRVMDTLRELVGDCRVEVYSVDEAFLDLGMIPDEQLHSAAIQIKETTEQWTGIAVSIGVAPTKVLSKVANRLSKKNKKLTGCVMVLDTEEAIKDALIRTDVGDIWGVGYRYAVKLKEIHAISNAWQLSKMNTEWARKNLGGIVGVRLLKELNGEPCVEMKNPLETKKMIATTRMFGKPVYDLAPLKEAIATYTSRAAEKLRRQYSAASFINVFVVTNEYKNGAYHYNPTTSGTHIRLPKPTSYTNELIKHAVPLVNKLYKSGPKYLKAGVMLGGIVPDISIQGNLFLSEAKNCEKKLMDMIDNINFSQRDDVLKFATSGTTRNWKMRQEMRSPRYTTRWDELFEVS